MHLLAPLTKKDINFSPDNSPNNHGHLFPNIYKKKYDSGPGPGKYYTLEIIYILCLYSLNLYLGIQGIKKRS